MPLQRPRTANKSLSKQPTQTTRCHPITPFKKSGLRADDPTEDVTLAFSDALVRLSVLELRTHLKLLQLARHAPGGGGGVGGGSSGVAPLGFQRWELPSGTGPRSSAVCLGPRPRDLDALLSGAGLQGRAGDHHRLLIATGGSKPPLTGIEVEEHPQRSTLARIAGVATSVTRVAGSVTSGVVGAASKAATLGPSLLGHGGWGCEGGAAFHLRLLHCTQRLSPVTH